MKTTPYLIPLLILFFVGCKPLSYQYYQEGKKQSENLNYSSGIELFLESWNKSPLPETARGLAQAYFKIRNFEQAEEWYTKLDREGELKDEDIKPYAEALIANSKYSEASAVLSRIDPDQSNPDLELIWKTSNGGKAFLNKSSESAIYPIAEVNSSFSEFGPMIGDDTVLYFTSDRLIESKKDRVDPNNALKSEVYGWTGNGFLKMYEVPWNSSEQNIVGNLEEMKSLQSDLHVGPMFQTGENIFLTLTQGQKYKKSEKGSSRNYTLFPEIFFTQNISNPSMDSFNPLPFNAPFSYTVSDPYYDTENSRLYFSSDMPGGQGNADLYYVEWNNGTWSSPVNLGPEINTSGDERTPFLDRNGILYFASSGHAGLGGLDIFKAKISNTSYETPENLGSPVNSNRDDFGLSMVPGSDSKAVFSSDRKGGKGLDDIYYADLIVKKDLILKGKVLDKETSAELEDAIVSLYNQQNELINTYVTEADGSFRIKVNFDQTVYLEGKKTSYLSGKTDDINIPASDNFSDSSIVRNIYLNKITVGKTYRLDNIYYDFDKWEIREDAKEELGNLIRILKENPTLKIELYSHTDSRGSDPYNLKLSDKRAKSAIAYLVESGIDINRLEGIGFGEEKLLNECANGIECTEEQHQENRRTEFKIIAY
ncbi:OmpA family protein [uncultured Algoriphagus sp.]|uniref:OmpA family protein n=1 Tax=uncultured Algoriphagus sp. TaxID=417365 RepID=UPI0030EE6E93